MFAVCGEDKNGFPIILLPAGRHNHRILLEAEGMEACLKWNIVWMEKLMNIIRKSRERSGKPVYKFHEILDMEGYSYKSFTYKPAIDYILETQKMFDENYPDVLQSVTVINAPRIFSLLFALVKPLIAKETLDKLTIYGCDEESWKQYLAQRFPTENLPPRWGGSLKGSDEFCSQETWYDGPIPLKYFKEVPEEDDEGYITVKISSRNKLELEYRIEESNTSIAWKFKTENHDIAFQLTFTPETNSHQKVIIPLKRVDSQNTAQEGSSVLSTSGTCRFLFDNRYSFTKSKTLKYQIILTKP